jgi:hypothetical protein
MLLRRLTAEERAELRREGDPVKCAMLDDLDSMEEEQGVLRCQLGEAKEVINHQAKHIAELQVQVDAGGMRL